MWQQVVAVAGRKAGKGCFVSVYIFIFGFTKVPLTELREHHHMVTADQILRVMLHKMSRPCRHIERWMLRTMLHRVSGP